MGRVTASLRSLPKPTLGQGAAIAGLLLLIGLIGARTWGLVSELQSVSAARTELEAKRGTLEERHRDLETETRYVQHPDNLETELRSRFNYKKPGENVIVVVPPEEQQDR